MTPGTEELPTEMGALADRCEQATGPDRDLDDAIATVLFKDKRRTCIKGLSDEAGGMWMFRYPNGSIGSSLRFTGSLDAAMTLVPEGFHHGYATGASLKAGIVEAHCFEPVVDSLLGKGSAATPALALCAAALRAHLQANPIPTSDSKEEARG